LIRPSNPLSRIICVPIVHPVTVCDTMKIWLLFCFSGIFFQSLITKMVKSHEKTNTGEGVKTKRGRTVSDDVGVKSLSETSKSVWTMCGWELHRCEINFDTHLPPSPGVRYTSVTLTSQIHPRPGVSVSTPLPLKTPLKTIFLHPPGLPKSTFPINTVCLQVCTFRINTVCHQFSKPSTIQKIQLLFIINRERER
jgi:hypothetical protein